MKKQNQQTLSNHPSLINKRFKDKLVLHRGIAVNPENAQRIKSEILNNGLGRSVTSNYCCDVRPLGKASREKLFNQRNISRECTVTCDKPNFDITFASADYQTANFYAFRNYDEKERKSHGLVISFEVSIGDVFVDGKDCLSSLFGLISQSAQNFWESQTLVSKIFGKDILRYLYRANESQNHETAHALYNLAIQDPKVIKAHAINSLVVGGRARTKFKSAFQINTPVPMERIISVDDADTTCPLKVDVDWRDLLPDGFGSKR